MEKSGRESEGGSPNDNWDKFLKRRLQQQEDAPPTPDNSALDIPVSDPAPRSPFSPGPEDSGNKSPTSPLLVNPLGLRFKRHHQPRSDSRSHSPVRCPENTAADDGKRAFALDKNRNISLSASKAKPFDPTAPDLSSIFANQGLNKFINPSVYILKQQRSKHYMRSFTDFMFSRSRNSFRKKASVKFPSAVVHKAEQHGETAGKAREVKKSQKPPRRTRRVAKTYEDDGYGLDPGAGVATAGDAEEDALLTARCCMYSCLKHFESEKPLDDGGQNVRDQTAPNQEAKVTKEYKKAMDKFAVYWDIADNFISETIGTIKYGLNLFSIPNTYRRPEAEELNMLAAEVWLFAFGVHHLFHVTDDSNPDQDMPSRVEFEELLTSFADLALAADRIAQRALLYAVSHTTFGREALRYLEEAARRLDLKVSKFKMPPTPEPGRSLKLITVSQAAKLDLKQVKIMVKAKGAGDTCCGASGGKAWENLTSQPKNCRLALLKALLVHVKAQVNSVNAQFRFLVEDVFNGKFDDSYPHFLMCLLALEGLSRKFARSNQTTHAHLDNLIAVNQGLIQEVQSFLERGQALIGKTVELRDMLQLAFRYLEDEYTLNMAGFVASKVELFPETTASVESRKWWQFCCPKRKLVKLSANQFMCTEFREVLSTQLIRTKNPEGALILKLSSPSQEAISVRFAEKDQESMYSVQTTTRNSVTMLEPPVGVETVWDNIENATPTELNKQVLTLD